MESIEKQHSIEILGRWR